MLGLAVVAAGLGAAGCQNDLNITDPNQPSSQTFWASALDAQSGVNAAYNGLLRLGTAQRWWAFAYDQRSDLGTSTSPWPELREFVKHQFPSGFDVPFTSDSWNDTYVMIGRANLAIANVPQIPMDTVQRAALTGEAKFLRGLGYYHLISLFGGNIPLVTTPQTAADRPASSDSAAIYAQIEKDFTEAAAALPIGVGTGRATKGAAQGMLGKVQLQQRKWAQAATTLLPVVQGQVGGYRLVANYGDLFRTSGNNGPESLFEAQMGSVDLCGQGLCGNNVSKMIGPCGPSFCDGLPTRWYFREFLRDSTTDGRVDPRLEATIFFYRGDSTTVFNRSWRSRYGFDTTAIYWKKYGEYYTDLVESTWEAQINPKFLRFADVLLMYAEALNEQGQPVQAAPFVNQVRARARLRPLPAGLDQTAMRAAILRERALEFGLEGQRWNDITRQRLFTGAGLTQLRANDPDFVTFTPGRSEVLPIPQNERNQNPNIRQNAGY